MRPFQKVSSLPPNEVISSIMQTNLKSNLSEVPEAPKKIVPEKKIPAAGPKKEKVPPAKGIIGLSFVLE